ncbi:heparinase II/III family protein [Neobacillus sp. DY30]|uniref:heparinase II/III family protein n=1 Tax=Neobacillus sp. DY30 TaxID=3047871 RepID=UPI0024BF2C07|nr:heparinase II/III family protein [Neobacillus sp. DY30]WHY01224.1 heparinase II/III family protein [Neobacillus sp. DY30]
MKNLLVSESPLLFSTSEEKNKWWRNARINPDFKPLIAEVIEEGERLLLETEQELSYSLFRLFTESGSRIEFEKVYFKKRHRLTTFAIMVLLEPENKEYVQALENTIWSICNEYSWCLPAHLKFSSETSTTISCSLDGPGVENYTIDLFAAETAFALAEILMLTEDVLDPLIRKRIYVEVYKRVFYPFKTTNYEWETQEHNWAAVCAGSIGAAALHLIRDPGELAAILGKVLPALKCYLKGFSDDGVCREGYGYWQYGFGYYVYFADLVKKKSDGKIDLFKGEKVHQIALFQQRCFMNEDKVVNFSDTNPTASVYLGLSHYLSKVYADFEIPERKLRAKFTADHCGRWAPAIRNLLWFDETLPDQPWGNGSNFFNDSQWFISRHQTTSGHFSFAAKGGNNNEPHNHNDIGHFILQGNSEVFFKDLGSGLYTKDYFSEKRYTYLCNGSQGHSVPIINHQYQGEGLPRYARILRAEIGKEIDIFELDIAKAYELDTLEGLTRKFTWMKGKLPKLVLEDRYSFTEQPVSIIERLIIPSLTITEEEDEAILEGEQRLRILYDSRLLYLEVKQLNFINHFGNIEEHYALDFTVVNPVKKCNVELIFQFD